MRDWGLDSQMVPFSFHALETSQPTEEHVLWLMDTLGSWIFCLFCVCVTLSHVPNLSEILFEHQKQWMDEFKMWWSSALGMPCAFTDGWLLRFWYPIHIFHWVKMAAKNQLSGPSPFQKAISLRMPRLNYRPLNLPQQYGTCSQK